LPPLPSLQESFPHPAKERSHVKATLLGREGDTVQLQVEVSSEEVQTGFNDTVKRLARDTNLPGFRKGKVPSQVFLQHVGEEAVISQMLDDHLGSWYMDGVEDAGIEPVDKPEVDFEEAPQRGEAFVFTAKVDVVPEAELGEYRGLEVPWEEPVVEDSEVREQLDRLREEFAELRPVEGRPAQKGDFPSVDFAGSVGAEPVEQLQGQDYMVELGSGDLLPELEEGMIGLEAGEEKVIPLDFPEDHGAESLAGKTVDFSVTVKEIKEKVLPEPNDELAKDVSEFETLLELRADIRQKLEAGKKEAADNSFRDMAVSMAANNAEVEVPEAVVNRRAEEMVSEFGQSLSYRGADLDQYLQMTNTTRESLVENFRPRASDFVRSGLVLDAVAKAEELKILDEEIDAALEEMAVAGQMDSAQLRAKLEESGRIVDVEKDMLRKKAAQVIVDGAVRVDPPEESEEGEDKEEEKGVSGEQES